MMKLLQLLEIKDSTPLEDVQKVFYTCQMTASAYFSKLEKIAENINAGYYDNLSNETTNFNELKNAAEEAIPYQTLMSSVLHKYVTGRLVEPPPSLTRHSTRTPQKRGAG